MAQLSLKMRIVDVPVGAVGVIVPANPARAYLALCNIGAGNCNLGFDAATPPALDAGWPLDAAAAAGRKGGSYIFETELVPNGAVSGFSAAGTKIAVVEG